MYDIVMAFLTLLACMFILITFTQVGNALKTWQQTNYATGVYPAYDLAFVYAVLGALGFIVVIVVMIDLWMSAQKQRGLTYS